MKNRLYKFMAVFAGAATLAVGITLPASSAFAQTAGGLNVGVSADFYATSGTKPGIGSSAGASASVGTGASVGASIKATAQSRADQEITRRITALTTLNTRVNAMTKISSSNQASLSATIAAQITAMNTLQTQIASDAAANSTSSLKTDIQSITKSYRIFMLIIPQGAIDAASDRVLDIAGMMTTLAGQLQTRITAAQAAGKDVSTSVSALADMNAKVADANTQANAAVSEIANLQPDNGDTTVQASNTAALKDARTKIQTAQQDLVAARKDAGAIVKALSSLKISGSASSTVTAQ